MAPQCPQRPYRARRPLEVAQAPLMSMAVCKCAQWPGPAAPRPRGPAAPLRGAAELALAGLRRRIWRDWLS